MQKIKFGLAVIFLSLFTFTMQAGEVLTESNYILVFDGDTLLLSDNQQDLSLGIVEQGAVCGTQLEIQNKSDKVLFVANVRGSCGLSIPAWPRKPLAPGEKAIIQLRYDSNRPGIINRNLTIHANTRSSSTILRVRGEVMLSPAKQ